MKREDRKKKDTIAESKKKWLRKLRAITRRLEVASQIAQEHIQAEIVREKNQRTAAARNRLFAEIRITYGDLNQIANDGLKEVCGASADFVAAQVSVEAGTKLVQPDPARVQQIFDFISPANGQNLAAVYTQNMAETAISKLRQALIEVSRQAALEGKTAAEIQRMLKDRWSELAGDDDNFRFVDRSGRHWDNDTYVQMLTRTTAQRAYNEAYIQKLVDHHCLYARIVSMGVPDCEICKEWNNRIVRITDLGLQTIPTIQDAQDAGVWHPNCLCIFAYIDDDDAEAEAAH